MNVLIRDETFTSAFGRQSPEYRAPEPGWPAGSEGCGGRGGHGRYLDLSIHLTNRD
jgi:hypothetical protein